MRITFADLIRSKNQTEDEKCYKYFKEDKSKHTVKGF
jgi:hypothetical protein